MRERPEGWGDLPFFASAWPEIAARISADPREVLPPEPLRFRALDTLAPDDVRVVILGQDPYPTPGHADGLAFSVAPGTALPRSLRNIFRELEDDLGQGRDRGDLSDWADQGVLLLNTALTTPAGEAGGHARLGWRALVEDVLTRLSDDPRAFVLWGNHAQAFRPFIAGVDHLIVQSAHPSPLSARRGFFGSRPFSAVNDWLEGRGGPPIRWT